jgi:hypothetical protein
MFKAHVYVQKGICFVFFPPLEKPRAARVFSDKNSGVSEREARVPEFLKNTLTARNGLFERRPSFGTFLPTREEKYIKVYY